MGLHPAHAGVAVTILPDADHPLWEPILSGVMRPALGFLGTKMLLGRLVLIYRSDPCPETLAGCRRELEEFFETNAGLPKVMADLESLFSQEGAA
jgi:hypothetical protein